MSNEQENKIKETAVAELLGMNFFYSRLSAGIPLDGTAGE